MDVPLSIATKDRGNVAEGLSFCFGLATGQNIVSYRLKRSKL